MSFPDRRNSNCKDLEVGLCLTWFRKSKETNVSEVV